MKSPNLQEKRKDKSPSQKARNLKICLNHKENLKKKMESTNSASESILVSPDELETKSSGNLESPWCLVKHVDTLQRPTVE